MSIRSKKTPVKHQPALRDGRRKRVEGEPRCEPVFPCSSGDFWQCPRVKEMQVLTCMLEELHVHLANLPAASAELLRCAGPACFYIRVSSALVLSLHPLPSVSVLLNSLPSLSPLPHSLLGAFSSRFR